MANVKDNVTKIRNAVYGNEVRRAIADAIDAMNTESIAAYSTAVSSQTSSLNSATRAESSAESARLSAEQAMANTPSGFAQLVVDVDSLKTDLMASNAGAHNCVYRGKYLGSSVTSAQYTAISSGAFTDLYIGDYWVINGVTWRIAAFDYYIGCGDSNCSTHHAVIVPDTCLYNHVMNDTNVTTGGYVGSKMYTEGLESAKSTIKTAFSGHVLKHRVYLTNATSNGKASSGAWCDSEVNLMNEQMVYGTGIFSPVSDGSNVPANYRVEKSQLPLFAHEPSRIVNRNTYWLRDVVTAAYFAGVTDAGVAYCRFASGSYGVRPAFCIS